MIQSSKAYRRELLIEICPPLTVARHVIPVGKRKAKGRRTDIRNIHQNLRQNQSDV